MCGKITGMIQGIAHVEVRNEDTAGIWNKYHNVSGSCDQPITVIRVRRKYSMV